MDDLVKAVLGDPLENSEKEIEKLNKENDSLRAEIRRLQASISIMVECVDPKKLTEVMGELYLYRRNDRNYKLRGEGD